MQTSQPSAGNQITPDNHGAYITITAAIMMVWMLLCFGMRMMIRFSFNGPFKHDDSTITVASVLGVLATISVFVAVNLGLGKRQELLSESHLINIQKAGYAGDILYFLALCLSRLSTAFLIARLSRSKEHLIAAYATGVFTVLWGVAGTFAIATRCEIRQPWIMLGTQCEDLGTRWIALGTIGIAIETVLILLPVYLVWNLQMARSSKAVVVGAFAFRLPVIAAGVLRIIFLTRALNSSDYTFESVDFSVVTMIELHYSLMAATIPCMKPFIKAFNTGFLGTTARQTEIGGYGSNSEYGPRDTSYALQSISSEYGYVKQSRSSSGKVPVLRPDGGDNATSVEHDPHHPSGSMTSDGSEKMIIRQTVGWNVRYDQESTLSKNEE
ncbi:MAG: hypothetical protein M1825_003291 [Sarcosagium campestre]|nr:MAG: hypothetical protein M1825_003291 [Sarcosagium campestre]